MKCDAVVPNTLPSREAFFDVNDAKNEGFVSVQIESSYSEYFNYKNFLQDSLSCIKDDIDKINSSERDAFVKNNFIQTKIEPIARHKKILQSIVREIEKILGNSNLSIEEKKEALQQISLEIDAHELNISIKGRNDQGKLEDVLTAFTATNTNLWKALIDSKIISTANFLYTCLPFLVSFLPLSLRVAEYVSIQFGKVWRGELSAIVEIYNKLSKAINIEIKLLDKKCQPAKLVSAKERGLENNCSEAGGRDYLNNAFIDAILKNSVIKRELINKLSADIININMGRQVSTPQSSLSNTSTFDENLNAEDIEIIYA